MAKYFGHKPSWRERQSSKATSPVLNFERQPSGVHEYRGNKTSVPPSGRKAGSPSVGRPTSQWKAMQKMKQRLAGFASKANIAYAVADALGNPDVMDYGWDDFMEGRLPPPFDWLNADIPPEWLPTKTPDQSKPMPPGTIAYEGGDGTWYGVPPAVDLTKIPSGAGTHFHRDPIGVPNAWPPPGKGFYEVFPDVKYSSQLRVLPAWDALPGPAVGDWYEYVHRFNPPETGPLEAAWTKTGYVYSRRYMGLIEGNRADLWAQDTVFLRKSDHPAKPSDDMLVENPVVAVGATEQEVMVQGAPGYAVWAPVLPSLAPRKHPYENLFKEIAGTRIVDIPVPDPVGEGGTKTIAPPRGPVITVPTKPGEPPHPPGKGTKERKRLVGGAAFFFTQKLFHGITEYADLVDALFEAIPKKHRCKTKSLVGKSACVFTHLDKVDIGDAIVNVAWNQFEDWVIGTQLFARNKKAAEARGDKYAFRTLNSANDYGGLNALGEAYGEFSKEYVNPTKQDLKDFLTKRFGI